MSHPRNSPRPPLDVSLLVRRRPLQQALAPLLADQRGWLCAPLTRRGLTHGCELRASVWNVVARPWLGSDRPLLDDWICLGVLPQPTLHLATLLTEWQPRRSQLVVAAAIDPERLDQWHCLVWNEGRIQPVTQLDIVGPGAVRVAGPQASGHLPDQEIESGLRASRTAGALGEDYQTLRETRVLLVGLGRGGTQLAQMLVAAGVRHLTLVDPDRLGPENLDAHVGARPSDVGRLKVVVAAQQLIANQPDLLVQTMAEPIQSAAATRLLRERRHDVVITFCDSDLARLWVTAQCQQSWTTHLDVGTHIAREADGGRRMVADVRLFEPGRGCAACVPGVANLDELLYDLAAPEGSLTRREPREWFTERAGSLHHWNGMACGVALETWLDYLRESVTTSTWRRMLWRVGGEPQFESAVVTADAGCRFCREV